jgi:hypothetical protein
MGVLYDLRDVSLKLCGLSLNFSDVVRFQKMERQLEILVFFA